MIGRQDHRLIPRNTLGIGKIDFPVKNTDTKLGNGSYNRIKHTSVSKRSGQIYQLLGVYCYLFEKSLAPATIRYIRGMPTKKHLIVVGGPTASGKTAFAVQLAKHFNTEIISCDSRQFFKEMNIGTAKPGPEEMQGIPHHFVDSHSVFEPYNVGDFEKEALEKLEILYQKYHVLIAVGGSGLYIKALCEGLDEFPEVPEVIRQEIRQLYAAQGLEGLQMALKQADPQYFAEVDQQNPHRLMRALEVSRASGQPFSAFRKQRTQPRVFAPIYIQVDLPRAEVYDRINRRVDIMMDQGLLEEVRELYPHHHLMALQTVGYQELFDYLEGKMSLEEAVEKIKQHSRNYAKRQLTWMRRDGFWRHFHPENIKEAIAFIENMIKDSKNAS